MIIALAQCRSVSGDIEANISIHKKYIEQAAVSKAELIVFPELSLTNYEPELARALAMDSEDERLQIFQQLSNLHKITIAVGVPLRMSSGITISLIFFQPHQQKRVYSKKYLHADEEPYFVSGENFSTIVIGETSIAPAICYEISISEHAEKVLKQSTHLYLASVSKTESGIGKAIERMKEIAMKYQTFTCICNAVGPADNFIAWGKSCVIDKDGKEQAILPHDREGLILLDAVNYRATEIIIESHGPRVR